MINPSLENQNVQRRSLIAIFLAFMVLFPEVGFYNATDVQPNFFILAILLVIALPHRLKLDRSTISYFLICFLALWIHFVIHQENVTLIYMLKYSVALLTILLCYILCSNNALIISNRMILTAFFIYILVGAIQFQIPDFLSFLVATKDTGELMLATGRGMQSLSAEPSHFGGILVLLNILYAFNSLTKERKRVSYNHLYLITFCFFLFNCLISQSFYACFYHFLSLIGISLILNRRVTFIILAVALFSFVSIITYLNIVFPEARFIYLLNMLLNNPELLLEQGAIVRALNVPMSLLNLSYFGVWGSGNVDVNWIARINIGFGEVSASIGSRLYGGFIEYVLKMGILSTPLVLVYLYMIWSISATSFKALGHSRFTGIIFAFMILILSLKSGSPASPLMIFFVIYVYMRSKFISQKNYQSSD